MVLKSLKPTAITIALGLAGAGFFWLIGFPVPALTGPAAVVSLATIYGVRTEIPATLRNACFIILGISIGSTVTPEVLATMRAWPLSLVILAATLLGSLWALRWILKNAFGFDHMTAVLASAPGHLSYVIGLSTELKANVPQVALVQSVRVLMLTLLVPIIITVSGAQGTGSFQTSGVIGPIAFAGVLFVSLGVSLLFAKLHVPAPFLIGAIVVSAFGHGSDLTPGTLPTPLLFGAFIVMGALIGTRFNGISRSEVVSGLGAGLAITLGACLFAAIGAFAASLVVNVPPAALLLAFSPGGLETMAAIAVETNLEPAFVAAHHVFRLAVLTVLFPLLVPRASS